MEKHYRPRIIVAAVVLAGAGAALFGWQSTPHAAGTARGAAASASPTRGDREEAGPTYTTAALFALGTTQEYTLDESSSVTTTTGQAISTLTLRGAIALTAVRARPTILVRGAFTGTAAATVRAGDAGPDQALTESARKPFVLEFATDGHLVRALGAQGVLPMIGRAWTSFGESLQLTRGGAGSSWRSTERDAAGSYTAAYEQRDVRDIWKHKLAYDAITANKATYDVLESRTVFTVDGDTHLSSLELGEKMRVTNEGLPGFAGTTGLSLKFTRAHVSSTELDRYLAEATAASPMITTMHDQQEEARDRERIGGMSAADVFSGVRAFTKPVLTREEKQKAARAFVAMAAMLRRDPSMLEKVKAHLAAKGSDTTMMLAALRDAATPAAQRVLADMSKPSSPLDAPERLEAARSLSRVERPTAETVEALKQLRGDPLVGTQATFGLGSVLHKLKDTDTGLAQSARQALSQDLEGATTSYQRIAALTAFGNAGDVTLLEQIRQQMTSDDPAVRAAAATALRRIEGPDADALLATLAADPAIPVRYGAVDAIGERTSSASLAGALSPLALLDVDFKVRSSAVTILARWLPDLPALEGTLRKVADSDPHRDIRNTASAALAMRGRLAQLEKR
jgi:HEAT repeat protein